MQLYLGSLVKHLIQMVILFALLFVLILEYPQLLSNCINVNFHHNLLRYTQECTRYLEPGQILKFLQCSSK